MKHITFIILFLGLFSCSNEEKPVKENNKTVMSEEKHQYKYLYSDDKGCIHTKLDCIVFLLDSSNYAVKRIPYYRKNEISLEAHFCSHCVSDEDYQNLTTNDTIREGLTYKIKITTKMTTFIFILAAIFLALILFWAYYT